MECNRFSLLIIFFFLFLPHHLFFFLSVFYYCIVVSKWKWLLDGILTVYSIIFPHNWKAFFNLYFNMVFYFFFASVFFLLALTFPLFFFKYPAANPPQWRSDVHRKKNWNVLENERNLSNNEKKKYMKTLSILLNIYYCLGEKKFDKKRKWKKSQKNYIHVFALHVTSVLINLLDDNFVPFFFSYICIYCTCCVSVLFACQCSFTIIHV